MNSLWVWSRSHLCPLIQSLIIAQQTCAQMHQNLGCMGISGKNNHSITPQSFRDTSLQTSIYRTTSETEQSVIFGDSQRRLNTHTPTQTDHYLHPPLLQPSLLSCVSVRYRWGGFPLPQSEWASSELMSESETGREREGGDRRIYRERLERERLCKAVTVLCSLVVMVTVVSR